MKTRAEDLEDAVREALQMLGRGRPADAQETLSAALDAPTDDRAVRRVALEEARTILDEAARIGGEEQWGTGAETPLVGRLASLLTAAKPIEPWRDPSFMGAMAAKQGSIRDATLEEAVSACELARTRAAEFKGAGSDFAHGAGLAFDMVSALQSAPAQVVSTDAVRRAMVDAHLSLLQREEMCRSLGVDLDATGDACACGHTRHVGRCIIAVRTAPSGRGGATSGRACGCTKEAP